MLTARVRGDELACPRCERTSFLYWVEAIGFRIDGSNDLRDNRVCGAVICRRILAAGTRAAMLPGVALILRGERVGGLGGIRRMRLERQFAWASRRPSKATGGGEAVKTSMDRISV